MPSSSSKESMLLELNDRATKNLTCLQLVTSVVGLPQFVACGHQFVERELVFPDQFGPPLTSLCQGEKTFFSHSGIFKQVLKALSSRIFFVDIKLQCCSVNEYKK